MNLEPNRTNIENTSSFPLKSMIKTKVSLFLKFLEPTTDVFKNLMAKIEQYTK